MDICLMFLEELRCQTLEYVKFGAFDIHFEHIDRYYADPLQKGVKANAFDFNLLDGFAQVCSELA